MILVLRSSEPFVRHPGVMIRGALAGAAVVLMLSCAGCGSSPSGNVTPAPAPVSLQLTRSDFDGVWPLIVDEVTLHCQVSGPSKLLTFDSGGKTYALNGTARDVAEAEGWTDLTKVWEEDGYGGHLNPSDLVSRGLTLCP